MLQKQCIGSITFSDFNAHTNELFNNLKLLKLNDIIKCEILKFLV